MSDALEVLGEVTAFKGSLSELHPLKLDRWHRALLGVPERIYMQYGCTQLVEQVSVAAGALHSMVQLLGADNLPLEPQELAQRKVGKFRWYVPSAHNDSPVAFQAAWGKDGSAWKLTCDDDPSIVKSMGTLEQAFSKSLEWTSELVPAEEIDEAAPDEG